MAFFKNLFGNSPKETSPEVLLEESSPLCPISAIVEQDGRVAYLYLVGEPDGPFGVKSCWVRNLQPAPRQADRQAMERGTPPLQPAASCRYPEGQVPLRAEDLRLIWLEEGDAVALLERNEVLAILPAWSGTDGFHGYARAAVGEGLVAWQLPENGDIVQRVHASERVWKRWSVEPDPWERQRPVLLHTYGKRFGPSDRYFAIDGGKWPPRGLSYHQGTQVSVFATVGVSLVPMPQVELYVPDQRESNRIELGLLLEAPLAEEHIRSFGESISALASLPWQTMSFLGEGHTVGFEFFPNCPFTSVLLLTDQLDCLPRVELAPYGDSPVNFLWMVPISERELAVLEERGAEPLLAALNGVGREVFSLRRREVV